ncbi:MAG: 16S rRNA (cytosine(1402)-N(4))-methyltransferase RsmH [Bacteroidales bacterium]|nr:16S rRNA (cytosine(1402)-N(4))-methyltransferase RsmH [Bacteroidales bacterium]MBK8883186.1 16S rRNA (cytosine(1402)-N(4))-methyltransferase RsmH [Bacteroidales bacterium]
MAYHIPALLKESIDGLNLKPDGIYVDVTFGGGGHSMEILKRLEKGKLIAFDQDDDAAVNVPADKRFLFLNQNFRFLRNNLHFNGIKSVDGLIADLGVSFHQFDEPSRGFTFRQDAPLDMRMNTAGTVTAAYLLNTMDEPLLANLFYNFGELTNSRRIAREIVAFRTIRPLATVKDIMDAVGMMAPHRQEHKFYAKLFQGLRIAVNHEIDFLKEMLEQALDVLAPGGRLVVITYHSLEDRVVKNFMRTGNFEGEEKKDFYGNIETPFRIITRKGITPGEEEIAENKRARSARLRVAEKI